jgi:hypothetical protein
MRLRRLQPGLIRLREALRLAALFGALPLLALIGFGVGWAAYAAF